MEAGARRPYRQIGFFFVVLFVLVLAGFTPMVPNTPFFGYFSRVASGGQVPALIHAHAIVAVAWFLLMCTQPFLVRANRVDLHRLMGRASLLVVAALLASGFLVTKRAYANAIEADVPRDVVLSLLAQPFTGLALFTACYVLALLNRRNLHRHVAFMVGASLAVATPGLARLGLYLTGGPVGIIAVIVGIYATLLCFMFHAKVKWRQPLLKSPFLVLVGLFMAAHALDLAGSRTAPWLWFADKIVAVW